MFAFERKNKAKLIYGNSSSYLRVWWGFAADGHERIFWDGRSVLYFNWSCCYRIHRIVYLRSMYFTTCKFCFILKKNPEVQIEKGPGI